MISGIQYYTLNGYPPCHKKNGLYLLNPKHEEDPASYEVLEDGSVRLIKSKTIIKMSEYCIEKTMINGHQIDNLVICLKKSHFRQFAQQAIYGILLTIGSFFLILTLIVQYSLPETRKTVHSKNLTAQTLSLLFGYIILTIQSLGYHPSSSVVCSVLGKCIV